MHKSSVTLDELVSVYKGINVYDLSNRYPGYSCVICGNLLCKNHNIPNKSCADHVSIRVEDWNKSYNFGKG